jgi:hypothetical protein
MGQIALKAMLNQPMIRYDVAAKFEGVVMAGVTGEGASRPSARKTIAASALFKEICICSSIAQ